MKKIKIKFQMLKSGLLISLLAMLGFSGCEGDNVQPEYGVPAVRDAQVKAVQKNNDSILINKEEITEKEK